MLKILVGVCGLALAGAAQAQVTIVNNIPGSFQDISSTGTFFNLVDDNSTTVTTTLGNAAFPAGPMTISNNGYVGYLPGGSSLFTNSALPAATNAGAPSLMVLWDDLITSTEPGAGVYYQDFGTHYVVQWNKENHFASTPSSATFQMKVFASGPVLAQMIYADTNFGNTAYDTGASATVGYQDGAGGATQWSFNQPNIGSETVLSVLVPAPGVASLAGLGLLTVGRRRRA